MPSAEYELRYLSAGIEQLEAYLKSKEIYWPIGTSSPSGEPPYPQLTLSGLLLTRMRAHARVSTPDQRAELARLEEQMDAIRSQWRVAWGNKAVSEFHARLILWRNFLEDYRESPAANVDRYAYEVNRRVQLQLLGPEAEDLPQAEISLLDGLDGLLRAVFVPGEFVWDKELKESFPPDPFWYLYGTLKKE